MSTSVDNRIVSMQFDNSKFERDCATTMSTLDKLKEKLNFKGVTESTDKIERSGVSLKNMFASVANSVDTLEAKISAKGVVIATMISKLTTQVANFGERLTSSVTVDPVRTGFAEYETQINAIQTILANTKSKGTTLDQVNDALDELNHYADQTIYNFTEMTRNIGTFTAAGVDLDTSVQAIKGIANLAAISGSNSQQAARGMYQLSQALAAGTVKLIDWNSVVQAGMGGQVFQDALMETARVHGIAIDQMIKEEGSFRESLQKGWLTSSILTETLAKFTGDLSKEELKAIGYTDEQIKGIIDLGITANDAATKVKTFTGLISTLKETLQSGWTQTWEYVIGDFEEAKNLWTSISDSVGAVINKWSESRNNIIRFWAGHAETAEELKTTNENLEKVAQDVIRGIYGSGKARVEALTKAGYDYIDVQNKVNELLGLSHRLTKEGAAESTTESKTTDIFSGRDMVIKGLTNTLKYFGDILKTVRDAWREVFPPMTGQTLVDLSQKFLNWTNTLHLGEYEAKGLHVVFKGLFTLLKGGLSVVGKIIKLLGAGLSKVADGISYVFSAIGGAATPLDKLNNAANGPKGFFSLSDKLRDIWGSLKQIFSGFPAFIEKVKNLDSVKKLVDIFSQLGASLKNLFGQAISKATGKAGDAFDGIKSIFSWDALVKIVDAVASLVVKFIDILAAAKNGIKDFVGKVNKKDFSVGGVFQTLSDSLGTTFDKLKRAFGKVGDFVKSLLEGATLKDVAKTLFYITIIIRLLTIIGNLKKASEVPTKLFEKIGGLISSISGTFGELGKVFKATALQIFINSLLELLSAVGMFAILASFDSNALTTAVTDVVAILAVCLLLIKEYNKTASAPKEQTNTGYGLAATVGAIGVAIFAIVNAMISVTDTMLREDFKPESMIAAVGIVAGSFIALILSVLVMERWGPKAESAGEAITKLAPYILSISASIYLMSVALGRIASIDSEKLDSAVQTMVALAAIIAAMVLVLYKIKSVNTNVPIKSLRALVATFSLMIASLAPVIALLGLLNEDMLQKGVTAIAALAAIMVLFIGGLTLVFRKAPDLSKQLLQMTGALAAFVGSLALLGALSLLVIPGLTALLKILIVIAIGGGLIWMVAEPIERGGEALTKFSDGLLKIALAGALGSAAIFLISASLERLGTGLPVFVLGLASAGKIIKEQLPEILTTVSVILLGVIGVILATKMPMAAAVVSLILAVGQALVAGGPQLLDNLWAMISILLYALTSWIGPITGAVLEIIVSLINNLANVIRSNAGRLAYAIINLIEALLELVVNVLAAGLSSILNSFGFDIDTTWIKDGFNNVTKAWNKGLDSAKDTLGLTDEDFSNESIFDRLKNYGFADKAGLKKSNTQANNAGKTQGNSFLNGLEGSLGSGFSKIMGKTGANSGEELLNNFSNTITGPDGSLNIGKLEDFQLDMDLDDSEVTAMLAAAGQNGAISFDEGMTTELENRYPDVQSAYQNSFNLDDTTIASIFDTSKAAGQDASDAYNAGVTAPENLQENQNAGKDLAQNVFNGADPDSEAGKDTKDNIDSAADNASKEYEDQLGNEENTEDQKNAGEGITNNAATGAEEAASSDENQDKMGRAADKLAAGLSDADAQATATKAGEDNVGAFTDGIVGKFIKFLSSQEFLDMKSTFLQSLFGLSPRIATAIADAIDIINPAQQILDIYREINEVLDNTPVSDYHRLDRLDALMNGAADFSVADVVSAETGSSPSKAFTNNPATEDYSIADVVLESRSYNDYKAAGEQAAIAFSEGLEESAPDVLDVSGHVFNGPLMETFKTIEDPNFAPTVTPSISPVLDTSSYSRSIAGINSMQTSLASTISMGYDTIASDIQSSFPSNDGVIAEIQLLRSDVRSLQSAMSQMKVVMDSNTVVGTLIAPIDRALGQRMANRERGH